MQTMHWSWPDLEATPEYVRHYCWDFLQIKRSAEAAAANRRPSGGRRA